MNKRIQELAEEANCNIDGMGYGEGNLEKFAELIVRECMSLVSEPGPDMNDTERGILAQIKKHFGVEE
jgi:hypothetical protein